MAASPVKLFVSHNEEADSALALILIDFIQGGLKIEDDAIRCTSLSRYSVGLGADVKPQLLSELRTAEACIGVITSASRESAWVIAELGIRLGVELHFAPVLHPEAGIDILPRPFAGHFAARADDEEQMLNLLDQVAEKTGCQTRGSVRVRQAAAKLVEAISKIPKAVKVAAVPAVAPSPIVAGERKLDEGKLIQMVTNYRGFTNPDVAPYIRGLLALGEYQEVLGRVLLEQEKAVRQAIRTGQHWAASGIGGYTRTYMDNLRHLLADLAAENLAEAEPVFVTFGLRLYSELERRGADTYNREFVEQAYLLGTEIHLAYGKGCGRLARLVLPENLENPSIFDDLSKKYPVKPGEVFLTVKVGP